MKKLCTLFVLLSLAATAAPPPTPTLSVGCGGGDAGGCALPEFQLTNVDPNTTYQIDGTMSMESFSWDTNTDTVIPSAGGIVILGGGFLDSGTWTFELHAVGHNGKEQHKILATIDVTL